jgi:hypothetical protein
MTKDSADDHNQLASEISIGLTSEACAGHVDDVINGDSTQVASRVFGIVNKAVSGCHITPEARLYILNSLEMRGKCPCYLGMFGLPDSFCQYLNRLVSEEHRV